MRQQDATSFHDSARGRALRHAHTPSVLIVTGWVLAPTHDSSPASGAHVLHLRGFCARPTLKNNAAGR